MWSFSWKLKAPSKLKIFIWRSLHGALPANCAILKRIVGRSTFCPCCLEVEESTIHVLVQCPKAPGTWFISKFAIRTENMTASNF
ncbi:hypothetical protein L6164_025060 [Bauhinia variegata]|uniref:Uncharacterized protein n=1 Tax=Bauhinia variegata TaxID=167791 RepID=A0ACB9M2H2_BAUVA|nr:hypothetical protein L6164_025060 [Bauhinia variegata]